MKIEWLLWCNDSNYFLGGESGAIFEKNLMKCLSKKKFDVITMWESKSIKSHCQSYFLCFNRKVINSSVYRKFWKNYVPLSYRSHAIHNGEIALSQCVLNRFNIQTIYNSKSIYKNILSNENYKNFGNILKYLPDSYCSDLNLNKKYYLFNKEELQLLINELEFHNPSHTYAFLNIITNKSPFLKKDIIKEKSFSYESAKDFILKVFLFS
jgi:Lipopolysaccharide biosynthesis protein